MRLSWYHVVALVGIAGCGPGRSPAPLRAPPAAYLLNIDQLVSPDFTRDSGPHAMTAALVAASGGLATAAIATAGFRGAATEDFIRAVNSLDTSNGPVQVVDTVEEFASSTGSAFVFRSDITRRDADPGSTAVSTGSLGDAAHATMRTAVSGGTTVVTEITVEWRLGNLLNLLVVRGRHGGMRPDDALLLAHAQTVAELGHSNTAGSPAAGRPAVNAGE